MERNKGTKANESPDARWKILAIGVAILAVASLAVLGAQALRGKAHQQSSTAARAGKKPPKPTPTPKPVSLASAPKGVVLDAPNALGTKQFTAAGDWGLDWSYDCSKLSIPSHFIVSVYDSQGHVSTDTPPVIQSGLKGSGTKQYHKPGTYFLGVNSKCEWHITAKAGAPSVSPQP